MRQVAILPAGIHRSCQTALHADKDHLYYRSSMALYVLSRSNYRIEKILCASDRSVIAVAFSPHDSNSMVMLGADGALTLWNIAEDRIINHQAIQKDKRTLLLWDPLIENSIIVISHNIIAAGACLHRWDVSKQTFDFKEISSCSDSSNIASLARLSPPALRKLALALTDGRVFLFEFERRIWIKLQDASLPSKHIVVDLQWDSLSSHYLLVAYESFMTLWDGSTAALMLVFEKQSVSISAVLWLDWAPGSFISSNEKTGVIKLWNASQKTSLSSFRIHVGGVKSMASIPGSRSILVAGVDGSFSVFDVANKHFLFRTSTGHSDTIFSCTMSPTASDRFATVWRH